MNATNSDFAICNKYIAIQVNLDVIKKKSI